MKIMETSVKKSHACTAALSALDPAAGHHYPMPPLETPGHSQTSLGQSLVGSLLLSPRSWCTRFCLCPPGVYFPDHLQINNGWINKTTISKNKGVFLVPKRTLLKVPLVVSFP